MNSSETSPTCTAPEIGLDAIQNIITIQLESDKPFEKYRGSYSYESLPIEFKVLFENIQEFYSFLTQNTQDRIRVKNGTLRILANIVGKTKEFTLPLYPIELSPEEQLLKNVYELKIQLKEQTSELFCLRQTLKEKDYNLQEKQKIIERLKEILKEKECENKKLAGRIRQMQCAVEELMDEDKGHKEDQHIRESPITEEYTPVKKTPAKVRKLKELQQFGKKIALRPDQTAKYYSKFRVAGSQIQKLHGPTYQLFSRDALPKQGKFFFDIRIINIKNNNIVVGVITDKNKQQQFSFKKMNCICYNGYDGSICQQDKQRYINIKPKENNKIRTVVDMTVGRIDWYILGGEVSKDAIGSAAISPSMSKQALFPYFELYWEGNKIKLNS